MPTHVVAIITPKMSTNVLLRTDYKSITNVNLIVYPSICLWPLLNTIQFVANICTLETWRKHLFMRYDIRMCHSNKIINRVVVSQIIGMPTVCSRACIGWRQRKYQSPTLRTFVHMTSNMESVSMSNLKKNLRFSFRSSHGRFLPGSKI